MERKYLYFQPEYVSKFKCDGAKCNARCCKNWGIFIDKASYKKYSQLADAQEIIPHMKFNSELDEYLITLTENFSCPFLNENNLCRLQKNYGEEFLSKTCATYPRYIYNLKNFFECTLTLTCPVAAELVLFQEEPMKFEFVEVPEKVQYNKAATAILSNNGNFVEQVFDIQIAQISILQERTLSIDQRLIVLGFFLDKLEELYFKKPGIEALRKLIAAYESKDFLREQVPLMLQIINFDAKKFMGLALNMFEIFYGGEEAKLSLQGRKFMNAVIETLDIKPDENNSVYEKLADARKNFREKYSTFLENYLVNELFLNLYPWRLNNSVSKNFATFLTSYKLFELIMFSATLNGFSSKDDLLKIVDWFTTQSNHNKSFYDKIIKHFESADDIFFVMESLLEK